MTTTTATKAPLIELTTCRRLFGGPGTQEAINRHSVRYYRFKGRLLHLDRNLSISPPCFRLSRIPKPMSHAMQIAQTVQVEGAEYFANGEPWARAERAVQQALHAGEIRRDASGDDPFILKGCLG